MFERIQKDLTMEKKLNILSDAAKYDVSCTSSGTDRRGDGTGMGNCSKAGICHSFSADGRCISLLKILFTNECIYDCKYCVNRSSNDVERASFTPEEVCTLTMEFYRRNYIEGLFLSSGILKSPDYTMEMMYAAVYMLRKKYNFQGYIHIKAIPGADQRLIRLTGYLADRMSINIELPSADSLRLLAPHKLRRNILVPMRFVQEKMKENRSEIAVYRNAPHFVPAGQSTQMIIGASPETDYQILKVSEALYKRFDLKRVFYSAFVPVVKDKNLPAVYDNEQSLLREHRIYQADWLLRFYHFHADELLNQNNPNFDPLLDPKCLWAVRHPEEFPVEINSADYRMLLRVPGIGCKSAGRIVRARKMGMIHYEDLKKMGVVLKRAKYFITCGGRAIYSCDMNEEYLRQMLADRGSNIYGQQYRQMSLFEMDNFGGAQIEKNVHLQ